MHDREYLFTCCMVYVEDQWVRSALGTLVDKLACFGTVIEIERAFIDKPYYLNMETIQDARSLGLMTVDGILTPLGHELHQEMRMIRSLVGRDF